MVHITRMQQNTHQHFFVKGSSCSRVLFKKLCCKENLIPVGMCPTSGFWGTIGISVPFQSPHLITHFIEPISIPSVLSTTVISLPAVPMADILILCFLTNFINGWGSHPGSPCLNALLCIPSGSHFGEVGCDVFAVFSKAVCGRLPIPSNLQNGCWDCFWSCRVQDFKSLLSGKQI